ncbi:MAG: hypothetical protein AB1489_07135 [Acidobacteriota bacterium]
MQVMLLSSIEMLCPQIATLQLQGKELIATGVKFDNRSEHFNIALIDVTPEVSSGQLNSRDLRLVEIFIRNHQQDIVEQIQELVAPKQALAASAV